MTVMFLQQLPKYTEEKMMADNISFETSLNELENIVKKLEEDNCTLDESIELFSRGVELVKNCNNCLNSAKLKIETLKTEG